MKLIRKRNQAWAAISPAASASPLLVLLIFVVVSGKALAAGKTNTCLLIFVVVSGKALAAGKQTHIF
ncbi:hypothetical protein [Roseiconus lacunae]|uniref:hypothetical protein n=1 Tax=Roseiconus lacunae TaxID=2605694 RepID=UPI001E46180F|nr:hypothetical protein [Roseiconus lacunae]MCD0458004.1 hypothetical protein [Roseiconus lacunae]